MDNIVTVIIAAVGCSAFWQLIQHLIESRQRKKFDIEAAFADMKQDVADMKANQDQMQRSIDGLSDIVAENEVVNKRVRILRDAEDVMRGMDMTKDRMDQSLSDCDGYEAYCSSHPNFKNNQTEMSIGLIKHQYQYNLEHGTFLTYKQR